MDTQYEDKVPLLRVEESELTWDSAAPGSGSRSGSGSEDEPIALIELSAPKDDDDKSIPLPVPMTNRIPLAHRRRAALCIAAALALAEVRLPITALLWPAIYADIGDGVTTLALVQIFFHMINFPVFSALRLAINVFALNPKHVLAVGCTIQALGLLLGAGIGSIWSFSWIQCLLGLGSGLLRAGGSSIALSAQNLDLMDEDAIADHASDRQAGGGILETASPKSPKQPLGATAVGLSGPLGFAAFAIIASIGMGTSWRGVCYAYVVFTVCVGAFAMSYPCSALPSAQRVEMDSHIFWTENLQTPSPNEAPEPNEPRNWSLRKLTIFNAVKLAFQVISGTGWYMLPGLLIDKGLSWTSFWQPLMLLNLFGRTGPTAIFPLFFHWRNFSNWFFRGLLMSSTLITLLYGGWLVAIAKTPSGVFKDPVIEAVFHVIIFFIMGDISGRIGAFTALGLAAPRFGEQGVRLAIVVVGIWFNIVAPALLEISGATGAVDSPTCWIAFILLGFAFGVGKTYVFHREVELTGLRPGLDATEVGNVAVLHTLMWEGIVAMAALVYATKMFRVGLGSVPKSDAARGVGNSTIIGNSTIVNAVPSISSNTTTTPIALFPGYAAEANDAFAHAMLPVFRFAFFIAGFALLFFVHSTYQAHERRRRADPLRRFGTTI